MANAEPFFETLGTSALFNTTDQNTTLNESVLPPRLAHRWSAFERMITPHYNLPNYEASLSTASDVFELMRTVLEVLSGRHPYFNIRDDRRVTMEAYRFRNPERPPGCHSTLDDDMWTFMHRSWSVEVRARPGLGLVREFIQSYHS